MWKTSQRRYRCLILGQEEQWLKRYSLGFSSIWLHILDTSHMIMQLWWVSGRFIIVQKFVWQFWRHSKPECVLHPISECVLHPIYYPRHCHIPSFEQHKPVFLCSDFKPSDGAVLSKNTISIEFSKRRICHKWNPHPELSKHLIYVVLSPACGKLIIDAAVSSFSTSRLRLLLMQTYMRIVYQKLYWVQIPES